MVPVIWVKDAWNRKALLTFESSTVKYMHDRTEK